MSYPTTLMISWFNVRNAKIGTPHPSVYVLILIICELDKLRAWNWNCWSPMKFLGVWWCLSPYENLS